MNKTKYKLTGLNCPSCAVLLECDLNEAGIKCKCSYAEETLEVEKDCDFKKIEAIVKKSGYNILS